MLLPWNLPDKVGAPGTMGLLFNRYPSPPRKPRRCSLLRPECRPPPAHRNWPLRPSPPLISARVAVTKEARVRPPPVPCHRHATAMARSGPLPHSPLICLWCPLPARLCSACGASSPLTSVLCSESAPTALGPRTSRVWSRMPSLKDGIRTSALSQGWRDLWRSRWAHQASCLNVHLLPNDILSKVLDSLEGSAPLQI
jgi:hypothetical protein